MIGLVLVTHGRLAEELRSAMEHVVGAQRNVATVCIGPEDDMEGRRADIHDSIARVDTGDGVVLLTDMFGGTPSNLAISMMGRDGIEVGQMTLTPAISLISRFMALVVSGMPFRFILSIILSSDFTRLFMFSIGFLS